MVKSSRIHYAWIIVAIASTMVLVTSSIRFAAAALVPHLNDAEAGFGWDYSAITLGFSLQWIVLGLVSPFIGEVGDKYGMRLLLLFGAAAFIVGMLLTGVMTNLWQYYIFFGVLLGLASSIFTILPISGMTLWFRKHLGVAMGAVWSFQGIGVIAFIFFIGAAFDQLGMKWIFWIPGITGGLLILVLTRFFYDSPSSIGLKALGALDEEPVGRPKIDDEGKVRASVFLQQAKKTGTFWNLIGIHFWGCMGHQIINVLLAAIAVDRGVALELALGVLIVQQVTGVFARASAPMVAERVGSKTIWVSGMALQAFPILIILVAHDVWAFYLFAVLFSIGQSCEVPTFPIANRQYYGNVPQGSLYGWQSIGSGFGMGTAPFIAGIFWDMTGTYLAPLLMSLGFSLMAFISAVLLPPSKTNLLPDWETHLPQSMRSHT